MTYYILVRRKREKKVIGIIPAKQGVSLTNLRKQLRRNLKSSLTFRIVTKGRLSMLLKRKSKRSSMSKRKIIKRRTKR